MKLSLLGKIRLKKAVRYSVLLILLAFCAGAIATNFFGKSGLAAASVTADAATNTITISGDGTSTHKYKAPNCYLIDSTGLIYRGPATSTDALWDRSFNDIDSEMDCRYYSYLFTPTAYQLAPATNLVINNSANVLIEGSQTLNSIAMAGASTTVSQPYPDREGKLNRPIYSNQYWAMRLTGYLKIPANSLYYIYDNAHDDGVRIEVSADDIIDSTTTWKEIYSDHTDKYTEGEWAKKYNDFNSFKADTDAMAIMNNTTASDKYVPIRISYANVIGNGDMRFVVSRRNTATPYAETASTYLQRNSIYAKFVADDLTATVSDPVTHVESLKYPGAELNHVNKAVNYLMDFEYYVSRLGTQEVKKNLTNGVLATSKEQININAHFKPIYGDINGASDLTFYYHWDWPQSPIGKSWTDDTVHNFKKAGRYSAYPINKNVISFVRRVEGGITLNTSGDITISGGSRIDLVGTGYPGATADYARGFGYDDDLNGLSTPVVPGDADRTNHIGRVRGGGPTFDGGQRVGNEFQGGGYSNAVDCNGAVGNGGSHGGQGGYWNSGDNHCRIEVRSLTYDTFTNPSQMGAGGGAGTDDGYPNIAGSGGGLIKIVAANLKIRSALAIDADGSDGERMGWHSLTGGAGGSINIQLTGQLDIGTGVTNALLARGGGTNVVCDPEVPSRCITEHVGGGGGLIYLKFNSSTFTDVQLQNAPISLVNGGDGGDGTNLASGQFFADGTAGVVLVDREVQPGLSIRKTLEPYKRNDKLYVPATGENYFNPYALAPNDQIKVYLYIKDVRSGNKITDEVLKQAVSPSNFWYCDADLSTALSVGVTSTASYQNTTVPYYVQWDVTSNPATTDDVVFSYICQVTHK